MKKVLHVIDLISEWIGRIGSFLLLVIIVATFYEVVVRYFLGSPTSWSNELSQICFAIYMMLGGCYVLKHKNHVCMDILSTRFTPRVKAITNMIGYVLACIFLVVLIMRGGARAIQTIQTNEHATTVWGPSMIPFRLSLPVGAALFLLQATRNFIADIMTLIKGEEYLVD